MRKALTTFLRIDAHATFPLWMKVLALLFLCVFIYSSWDNYGLTNFLWFSCVGLIGSVLALWLESRMLASMMLLATFMADVVAWGGDFLFRLLIDWHPLGATRYMFDQRISTFSRAISLYHLIVPPLLALAGGRDGLRPSCVLSASASAPEKAGLAPDQRYVSGSRK